MLRSQFSAIFDNFRRKKWSFSQKPMLWSFFHNLAFVLSQKHHFFADFLAKIFFLNHSIGPRTKWFLKVCLHETRFSCVPCRTTESDTVRMDPNLVGHRRTTRRDTKIVFFKYPIVACTYLHMYICTTFSSMVQHRTSDGTYIKQIPGSNPAWPKLNNKILTPGAWLCLPWLVTYVGTLLESYKTNSPKIRTYVELVHTWL
jgi:hypothetical protein